MTERNRFSVTRETTLKAQRLRQEATPAERKLWAKLKDEQVEGLKFRTQHPIGPYIVDFYCAELKLAIELDGDSHGLEGAPAKDSRRTAFLQSKGVEVMRFWNGEVHDNTVGVVELIIEAILRKRHDRTLIKSAPTSPRKIGPWAVELERAVYDNPWITVKDYKVTRPDGAPGQYGVVAFKHLAIGVLPLFDDGTVPLVGQHRFPLDAYSWELPEGGGKLGADPLEEAKRELAEETGLSARHWRSLVAFDLSNSVTDEKGVGYLAWGLAEGRAEPDGDEILAHRRLSFSLLHKMVLRGDIRDSLTMIMVLTAKAKALDGLLPEAPSRLILGSGP